MNTAAKIPTIYTHYRVNGDKVTEKTYKLVRATLQMQLLTPYQEHKQRISLSNYSIHTIFEITF